MKSAKVVTIFGSSRTKKNSKEDKAAYQLGKLLAEAGFIVCNGGYGGTMAASSRGAKEAGGKTIGITTEIFKKASPNSWIDVKGEAESSMQRLMVMTSLADAFIVLKGGIGTLAEMTFVWASASVRELRKPIVLVGDAWQKTIDRLSEHLLITNRNIELLKLVKTPEEAVDFLNL